MTIREQEQIIPGDLLYGNSHGICTALAGLSRAPSDPDWRAPEQQTLSASLLAQIDAALLARHASHILASNTRCVADWLRRGMLVEAQEAGR